MRLLASIFPALNQGDSQVFAFMSTQCCNLPRRPGWWRKCESSLWWVLVLERSGNGEAAMQQWGRVDEDMRLEDRRVTSAHLSPVADTVV